MSLADAFVAVLPDMKQFGPAMHAGLAKVDGKKAGESVGRQFGGGVVAIAKLALAGLATVKIGEFLKGSIDEAREAARVTALTEAAIKATGGAAKVSAGDIASLAGALSTKVGIDDEVIQGSENMLLAFKKVRNETGAGNDVFNRATADVLDMSTAMGISLPGATKALGKALNDPIKGMGALGKAGVQFTDAQKASIKTMIKSGDIMGAQKLILSQLEGRFKGAAAAAASPADKAKVAWQNFQETAGGVILPALNKLSDWFVSTGLPAVLSFGKGVGGLIGWFDKNRAAATTLATAVGALFTIMKLHSAFLAVEGAGGLLKYLGATRLVAGVTRAVTAVQWAWNAAVGIGSTTLGTFVGVKAIEFGAWVRSTAAAVSHTVALVAAKIAMIATTVATKAWAAGQWLLNAALTANPIGIVIAVIALLIGAVILAYQHSDKFRTIVQAAWQGIQAAAKFAWESILKPTFKFLMDAVKAGWEGFQSLARIISGVWEGIKTTTRSAVAAVVGFFLDMAGKIIAGAVKAFGWVPTLGDKLRTAQGAFNTFRDGVNSALGGINDRTVTVRAGFNTTLGPGGFRNGVRLGAVGGPVTGGRKGQDSVPYLLMPDEFIVRRDGSNLVDALRHFGAPGMAAGGLVPRVSTPSRAAIGSTVEAGFAAMIQSVLPALRKKLEATMSAPFTGGSGVARWAGVVAAVLRALGQSQGWMGAVLRRMQFESGGNPTAINLKDSNARAGHPSQGLMQTIPGTFAAFAGPYASRGITDPFANIYAGLNYAIHRYGSIGQIDPKVRPRGYDMGGMLNPKELGLNSGRQPERVLSGQQTASFDRLVNLLERGGGGNSGPSTMVLLDTDGALIGRMRVEASDVLDDELRTARWGDLS